MAINSSDFLKFIGWQLMIFITETCQRFQGTITGSEDKPLDNGLQDTTVMLRDTFTDMSDNNWIPAQDDAGNNISFYRTSFDDWQKITPSDDGVYSINHTPAEQILVLIPENHPNFLKLQLA